MTLAPPDRFHGGELRSPSVPMDRKWIGPSCRTSFLIIVMAGGPRLHHALRTMRWEGPVRIQIVSTQPNTPAGPRHVLGYFSAVALCSTPFWLLGRLSGVEWLPGVPASGLMVLVPASVAILWMAVRDGRAGALRWLHAALRWPVPGRRRWLIVALALPPATTLAAHALLLPPEVWQPTGATSGLLRSVVLFAALLLPALLEELGWCRFAMDGLRHGLPLLTSALVVGVVWAAWHVVPLLQAGRALPWMAWWSVGTLALRVLIAWVDANAGRGTWAAAILHAASNAAWQAVPVHGSHYSPEAHALVLLPVCALVLVGFGPRLHRGQGVVS